MYQLRMEIPRAIIETGDTYFGTKHTAKIDYLLGPRGLPTRRAWVDHRRGRKTQLIPCSAPRDHSPLIVEVDRGKQLPTASRIDEGEPNEMIRWDHDKIAAALKDEKM